jgi:integrase
VFYLEEFRDYLQFERGVSPRTLEAYGRDLKRLVEYAKRIGIEEAGTLTSTHLREFVYDLKDQGLQATSIRRTLSGVRTYFTFLLAEGHVKADPTEQVDMPKTWRRLPGVLSREDVESILEAPDIADRLYWRDKALLEFAYASGVRVSELATLKVRDVDLADGVATVFGKGSKERMVPIGRSAQRALDIYIRESRPNLAKREGQGTGHSVSECSRSPAHADGHLEDPAQTREARRCKEARDTTHAAALFCHTPLGRRRGSRGCAGDAWPCRYLDDADLYACGSRVFAGRSQAFSPSKLTEGDAV